jgi:formylglycine-generating enzyme required for sulfatase activity
MSRLLTFLLFVSSLLARAETSDNPKPSPGDLTLPMPDGHCMVFRPIFLGIGDKPFALREFRMGSSIESLREKLVRVHLGGSFLAERNGTRDWLFYIGKYEVTASQFAAISGTNPASSDHGRLPVVGLSFLQVQEFIQKYNIWLLQNAVSSLPGKQVVVRLPTEPEWEFAARGGVEVENTRFDFKTPYPSGQLANYEWFAGPKSSHGKLKAVGLLEPNPAGLHDMLGNAEEMATGYYQVPYLHGRTGGFVSRGENFRTPEKELRSSARTEIVPFADDGSPAVRDTVGLRLVLAVPVMPNLAAVRQLEEENAKRRAGEGSDPGDLAPIVDQADSELTVIKKSMSQMEKSLPENARADEGFQAKLEQIKASQEALNDKIKRAERIAAEAGTRLAYGGAGGLLDAFRRNIIAQKFADVTKPEERAQLHAKFEAETKRSWARYQKALEFLSEVRPEVVRDEFKTYIEEDLQKRDDKISDFDAEVGRLAQRHYEEYARTGRANQEKWNAEFAAEAKRIVEKTAKSP